MNMKKTVLGVTVLMALGSTAANAITTTGNNFTKLGGAGLLTGGTNE